MNRSYTVGFILVPGGYTILKPYDTVVYYYLYGHIGIHWKYYSLVDCVHVAWRERSAQDFYKYRGGRGAGLRGFSDH